MNTEELGSTLHQIFSQPTRSTVLHLQGPPGVGKTAIVSQAAAKCKKTLTTIALPTCEAVDLRGMPTIVAGRTVWASPMPREGEGVLLLDELSSAPPDVQVAAHHVVWSESGSDMNLPEGWHVVLTGNRASDRTLYRAPSAPLRNRMTVVTIEPDIGHWAQWAMGRGISSAVVGFLRWRPELLAAKEIPADGAFVSPRAWERVSSLLPLSISASAERELILGTVGEAAATEFAAYLRTVRELPSIRAILDDPQRADVPTSPSLLYALTTALASHTRVSQESAMEYCCRIPAEFALLYIRDVRDHFNLRDDKNFRVWVGKHKTLFREDV